jgi:catechol 2,3-dioxygenase-like lactoylglutathione lyase family enzyme
VPDLIGVPGAQLQVQIFRLPGGFGFELTHFGNIELKESGQPRLTDPGVAKLTIRVRDMEPVLTALKRTPAKGDLPIVVRDPDGYPVEVLQVSPTSDAPAAGNIPGANILSATMGLAVSDLERTLKFYHDLLGFELTGKMEFVVDKRQIAGNVPGTKARIEFYEFKGVPRTPFHLRVPDPGCPAIALRVADLDGLLKRMKAAGVKIISAGGVPAQFSPTIRNIFVEDPDGFKIELYQASQ